MPERFSFEAFDAATSIEQQRLASELSSALKIRLKSAVSFHEEVERIIEELRKLGHDLWSFDADVSRQLWCPDWGKTSHGLHLNFYVPDHVLFTWRDA